MLYSDSKAGKTDSTSQCEEYQSGQLSSITEEVRKVGRGQILWAVAGYGRCYSECDRTPLKGFEQRMTRPNLCFTYITLAAMQRSGYGMMMVETRRPVRRLLQKSSER